MKRSIKGTQWMCDNPDCTNTVTRSKEQLESEGSPIGLEGSISWVNYSGADGGTWWACSPKCAVPAILDVFGMNPDEWQRL